MKNGFTSEIIEIVNEAIDSTMNEFMVDESILFNNESSRFFFRDFINDVVSKFDNRKNAFLKIVTA